MIAPKTPERQFCSNCNVPMKLSDRIGGIPLSETRGEAFAFGLVLEVSVYACPDCGVVRMYSANVLQGKTLGEPLRQ